jgi:hypothetical protein
LKQVSDAFSASASAMGNGVQPSNRLQAQGERAIARGIRQLEQLAQSGPQSRLSQDQQSALGREAVGNLTAGLEDEFGRSERTSRVLDQLREQLEQSEQHPEPQLVAELLREIRRIRRSIAQNQAERADQPEGTFIDPARLPPTYRTPIQTYFEKLSEKR